MFLPDALLPWAAQLQAADLAPLGGLDQQLDARVGDQERLVVLWDERLGRVHEPLFADLETSWRFGHQEELQDLSRLRRTGERMRTLVGLMPLPSTLARAAHALALEARLAAGERKMLFLRTDWRGLLGLSLIPEGLLDKLGVMLPRVGTFPDADDYRPWRLGYWMLPGMTWASSMWWTRRPCGPSR